jgi:hypothetical protein
LCNRYRTGGGCFIIGTFSGGYSSINCSQVRNNDNRRTCSWGVNCSNFLKFSIFPSRPSERIRKRRPCDWGVGYSQFLKLSQFLSFSVSHLAATYPAPNPTLTLLSNLLPQPWRMTAKSVACILINADKSLGHEAFVDSILTLFLSVPIT